MYQQINCKNCGKAFVSKNHGGTKQFCSYSCAATGRWKTRERKPPSAWKLTLRTCRNCGTQYARNKSFTLRQWSNNKFCSARCAGIAKRINDGMTKGERHRRKIGRLKQNTPEWLERIRSTTKEAMHKPEINWKLRQPRAPMSLAARAKHSDALAGRLPANMAFGSNGGYPHIQRGEYECSKGSVYFRSKWEANYALYLDFLVKQGEIKNWEYEADVFIFEKIQFGTRSYRPDFKIENKNKSIEYHEVKGYMDSKSKTKLRRMARYYPEVKLILIDGDVYRTIQKQVGKMLNFY